MAKDEKKTITVNDVEYNLDDFTAEQSVLLNHVQDLDRKLSNAQFNLDQLSIGRQKFVELLAESLEAPAETTEVAAE
jgi:hypothetical protein